MFWIKDEDFSMVFVIIFGGIFADKLEIVIWLVLNEEYCKRAEIRGNECLMD